MTLDEYNSYIIISYVFVSLENGHALNSVVFLVEFCSGMNVVGCAQRKLYD